MVTSCGMTRTWHCALHLRAQSTWTTPTLTLLYITLMASPVCFTIHVYICIYIFPVVVKDSRIQRSQILTQLRLNVGSRSTSTFKSTCERSINGSHIWQARLSPATPKICRLQLRVTYILYMSAFHGTCKPRMARKHWHTYQGWGGVGC